MPSLLTLLQAVPERLRSPSPPCRHQARHACAWRPSGAATGLERDHDRVVVHYRLAPIEGVTVNMIGPVDREVKSPASGPTRIDGLRAGTYRVRFAHAMASLPSKREIRVARRTGAGAVGHVESRAAQRPRHRRRRWWPSLSRRRRSCRRRARRRPCRCSTSSRRTSSPGANRTKRISSAAPASARRCCGKSAILERAPACVRRRDDLRGGRRWHAPLGEREVSVTNGSFAVVPRGTTYGSRAAAGIR